MKPVDEATPDKTPPKLVTVYLPSTLAISSVIFSRPLCECTGWSLLLFPLGMALGTFLFSWPFIVAGYHGYRFFRSLLQRG